MSAPPPFAIILPSRPVYAAPTALSPTQYAFSLPTSPPFTHIIVFLLPGTTLPPDTLAGVYVQFPNANPVFKFLGAIGNDKQSALFRVGGGLAAGPDTESGGAVIDQDEMTDVDAPVSNGSSASMPDVVVGVSIESAASIQAQSASLKTSNPTSAPATTALVLTKRQQASPLSTKALAQKIIQNAYNFLASFAGTTGHGSEEVIPLRSFKAWWEKFERRVEVDPSFLERESDD